MRLFRNTVAPGAFVLGLALACPLLTRALDAQSANAWLDPYRQPAQQIIALATSNAAAWQRLAELGDTFGHRLTGSAALEKAITWAVDQMKKRQLGLRPRRTLRVVLFVNEETEQRGGIAYRDQHRADLANHVLMLESDSGVFRPLGFGFTGSDQARAAVTAVASLLSPIGADRIGAGGGGADIGPSVQAAKVPSMSLDVDGSKYFLIHHTPADTVDKINPGELARCVAALAVMGYVVADMPERLAR